MAYLKTNENIKTYQDVNNLITGIIFRMPDKYRAGKIVELAETEKLFKHPLHPYTRALLSAVPMPDPVSEKNKVLTVYDPSVHHYEKDKPVWTEIEEGHFVYGNNAEIRKYEEELEK